MSIGCRVLLFCGLFFSLVVLNASVASAQGVSLPSPSNPIWTTTRGSQGPASAPSPDAACRIQHQRFNPGAVYLPPVKVDGREDKYSCRWLSSQMPGGSGNTILPAWVDGTCAGGNSFRKGMCVDTRTETPDCDRCDTGGSASIWSSCADANYW